MLSLNRAPRGSDGGPLAMLQTAFSGEFRRDLGKQFGLQFIQMRKVAGHASGGMLLSEPIS